MYPRRCDMDAARPQPSERLCNTVLLGSPFPPHPATSATSASAAASETALALGSQRMAKPATLLPALLHRPRIRHGHRREQRLRVRLARLLVDGLRRAEL